MSGCLWVRIGSGEALRRLVRRAEPESRVARALQICSLVLGPSAEADEDLDHVLFFHVSYSFSFFIFFQSFS